MQDNISKLYGVLKDTYDLGSEEDFRKYLSDSKKREALRKELESEYEVGDSVAFTRYLGFDKPTDVKPYNGDFTMSESELDGKPAGKAAGTSAKQAKPQARQSQPQQQPVNIPSIYDVMEKERENAFVPSWKPKEQEPVNVPKKVGALDDYREEADKMMQGMQRGVEDVGKKIERQAKYREAVTPKTFDNGAQKVEIGNTESAFGRSNPRVIEGETRYNPLTQKFEKPYINEFGEYPNRALAEAAQNPVDAARKDFFYRESMTIDERIAETKRNIAEIDDKLEELGYGTLSDIYIEAPLAEEDYEASKKRSRSINQLLAAQRDAEKRLHILEESKDKEKSGFWRNLSHVATNPLTWTFGLVDVADALTKHSVANKLDEKSPLTDAEQTLLQQMVSTNEARQMFGDDMGAMARWGTIAGEALPFVVEFMLTGGFSGLSEATAEGVTKGLAKLTATQLEKKGLRSWLVKATGTTIGDLTSAAAMANTTGAAKTMADALERHDGNAVIQDANGEYHFGHYEKVTDGKPVFVDGGKTWARSIYEAEAANTIEYYTEMLGTHMDKPLGALASWIAGRSAVKKLSASVLKKLGLGEISRDLSQLTLNAYGRAAENILKRAKIDSIPGEILEEEANIGLNAMFVGDNSLSDYIDGRTQADIIGGMFFSVGFMQAMPASYGAYKASGYLRAKHNMDKSSSVAAWRLTADVWEQMRENIDATTNEHIADRFVEVMNDNSLSREQKKAVMDYIRDLTKFRGYNMGMAAQAKDITESATYGTDGSFVGTYDYGTNTSYMGGYNAEGDQLNDIKNGYEYMRQQVAEAFSEEDAELLEQYPIQRLHAIANGAYSDYEKKLALDYVNAKATYDGMIARVGDDIDSRIAESDMLIGERRSKTDGMIHPATMKAEERKVYVVDGNVSMMQEGTMVDVENSDESVIVRDAETGEISFVSPHDILSVDEAIDAYEEMQNARQAIQQEYAQQAADKIDGVLPFNVGDTYTILDEEGQQHEVTVVDNVQGGENGLREGDVLVSIDGEQVPQVMPMTAIQDGADNANLARLAEYEAQKAAEEAEQTDGGTLDNAGGEASPEQTGANDPSAATSDAMPMIGEGEEAEPDYLATTPERGHQYLYDETGFDREVANKFADNYKKQADDELAKLQKKQPQPGTSIAKYKREMAEWQMKLGEAQAKADYWQAVKDIESARAFAEQTQDAGGRQNELDAQRNKQARIDAAKQMYGDYFNADMSAPQDIYEMIAMNLPKGISWEGREGVRGLQQELGALKRKFGNQGDTTAFNTYLSKKGEGISIDDAIHQVWESADNQLPNGEQLYDSEQIRAAVIEMFMQADKPRFFEDYVLNSRIAAAEKMRAAEDEAIAMQQEADEIMRLTGLTPEEYDAWIEGVEAQLAAQEGYESSEQFFNTIDNDGQTEENAGTSGGESVGEVQGEESNASPIEANAEEGTGEDSGGIEEPQQLGGTSTPEEIKAEEAQVNAEPTEAQKEAGNYKKGHIKVDGFDVTIENPKGSVRRGVDASGKAWEQVMNNTYGYIRGTEGVDGDHIDVFLSDNPESGNVFVIDQRKADGSFDEHKVMYGFPDMESAKKAYLSNYEDGWQGLGAITEVSKKEFKKWIESSHRKTKPFSEYALNFGEDEGTYSGIGNGIASPAEKVSAEGYDKPIASKKEAEDFLKSIGYDRSVSRVSTGTNGKKYIRYHASGVVTPNIVFGETTPRDVYQQFHLYGNVIGVNIPADLEEEFSRQEAEQKAASEAIYANEREEIKSVLKDEGIPFHYVIDSERGSRIVFTDKKNDNGNYTDYVDVADVEQAKDDIEFIRERAKSFSQEEEKTKEKKPRPTESKKDKIDDVGEVIEGARKQLLSKMSMTFAEATKQALADLPFAKAFKKPDLKKAIENGVLREKDAIFYEVFFNTGINQQKPKVTMRDERMKKWKPDYKTDLEKWIDRTYETLQVLKGFIEADEATRDEIIDKVMSDRFPNREAQLAEIERVKALNPNKTTWGDNTTPNPMWITYEVLQQLGHEVGDKVDLPFSKVEATTDGTGYILRDAKGNRLYLKQLNSVDDAIAQIVWLAKLKRGDSDIQHPVEAFSVVPTESVMGETGRYEVMWMSGLNIKIQTFDTKEEADAAAAKKKGGARVTPERKVVGRKGYKVAFNNPLTGERFHVNEEKFDTKEEGTQYLDSDFDALNEAVNKKLEEQRNEKKDTKKKELTADDVIGVGMVFTGGKWQYGVWIDKKYANNYGMNYPLKEGFATMKEAKEYKDKVKDEVFKAWQEAKESRKAFAYFDTGEDSRRGEDWRGGNDVTAEDFMNEFGFRGVQFGNWTNQRDRQMAINQAYDAFMDLAKLIGVSPKALSLNGELGIAFGARGVGNALAHYEPSEIVINLTKKRGAGSLAHEWWHALDNYFARAVGEPGGMVTDDTHLKMRDELRKAFNDMLDKVRQSDYYRRSRAEGDYWGRMHEVTARLLAEWVDQELKKRGELNTFLSRGANVEPFIKVNYDNYVKTQQALGEEPMPYEEYMETKDALRGMPYPSAKEVEGFADAMRNIFDTIQERVDEETGKTILYQKAKQALPASKEEKKIVKWLAELLNAMGIKTSTDWKKGQRVLDAYKELADFMSRGNKKTTPETASVTGNQQHHPTVVSSVDGAKILKNLEKVARDFEKLSNQSKFFIGTVGKALNAKRYGSKSEYADFVTDDGTVVSIRLADHNAKAKNSERAGRYNVISIVIAPKKGNNKGILNDGKAHIAEYYYEAIDLRKAEGKPLADIVRAIADALHTGKFIDPTGLAKPGEVNAETLREMRVYHGSGADFDAFDHRHMGEGEGYQAYGWGSYVTEVEGIGRTYAKSSANKPIGSRRVLYKGEDFRSQNTDEWPQEKESVFIDIAGAGMQRQGKSAQKAIDDLRIMTEQSISNQKKALNHAESRRPLLENILNYLKGVTEEQYIENKKGDFKDVLSEEEARILNYVYQDTNNIQEAIEEVEFMLDNNKKLKGMASSRIPELEVRLKYLNEFDENDFTREEPQAVLYTVEIPDGLPYLEYNRKMGEQQDILDSVDNELTAQGWKRQEIDSRIVFTNPYQRVVLTPNQSGADLYEELKFALGGAQAASEFLRNIGVAGIKYPAEYRSGGRSDGASNYVIFDENDLQITDKIKFFRTSNGEAYGFTLNGKIYLDPRIATSETPIHEYAHLWAQALRQANPEAWEKLKDEMRNEQDVMDYVKRLYPEITDEEELMEEVFTHYSGKRGAERLRNEMREEMAKANGILEKARVANMFRKLGELLKKFWEMSRDLFAGKVAGIENISGADFADMMMADLMNKVDPRKAAEAAIEARDKEYAEAVAAGDKEKVDAMLREEAARKGYTPDSDYQGTSAFNGAAPARNAYFPTREERIEAYNNGDFDGDASLGDFMEAGIDLGNLDWLIHNPIGYYTATENGKESIDNLRGVVDGKKQTITMYRSVPADVKEGEFRNGDWVTPSRSYAEDNAYIHGWEDFRIIEQEVPVDAIWWDNNDINEWGYDNGNGEVYKNTENNRKLLEPTYDEEGNLIPLSQRFNENISDIRYQFVGEQGATEADRAEGVVTRIENLGVAKQMEQDGKTALSVKMATGWERGKDGKWRYETQDDLKAVDAGIDYILNNERKAINSLERTADMLLARLNRLDAQIPKRLTDKYSEEEKAKYMEMRKQRDKLYDNWTDLNRLYRERRDDFNTDGITVRLENILGEDYELFKYYPEMRNMSVLMTPRLDAAGEYDSGKIRLRMRDGMASTLLHEIQHAIQEREGFAKGGNIRSVIDDMEVRQAFIEDIRRDLIDVEEQLGIVQDAKNSEEAVQRYAEERGISLEDARSYFDAEEARLMLKRNRYNHLFSMLNDDNTDKSIAFDYYKRIAGEVESRNVQERANMTPEERRRTLAEETEDTMRGEQIVTYGEGGGSASIVEDEEEIARLEAEPKEIGYRNVVLNDDGTLGSPMASKLGKKGTGRKATSGFELDAWERSDEHPELATEDGKIDLIKPDGKTVDSVDYNPYIHIRPTLVNKQFKQAWERPNLVYVRTQYPTSELTSGYQAEKAKKSVGRHDWNGGELVLSRWDKPIEIVPWEEVADDWVKEFDGKGIHFDIIPPMLLPILAERGMEILPPHKGMGKACNEAYRAWKEDGVLFREGEGEGEPVRETEEERRAESRMAGYSKRQYEAWREREYRRTVERVNGIIDKLNLRGRVMLYDSFDDIPKSVRPIGKALGKAARAKGWFDEKTGQIVVILGNHGSVGDFIKTILHEGVAHYGLRRLFGSRFNQFLDNVFENADESIRREIVELSKKYGWDFHTATEEYLARLAEDTDFENAERSGWWQKVKSFFLDMLHSLGLSSYSGAISDNELRYILWRSYKELSEPGSYRNLFRQAEDIDKQMRLGVGRFEKERIRIAGLGLIDDSRRAAAEAVAEGNGEVLFRDGDEEVDAGAMTPMEKLVSYAMLLADRHKDVLKYRIDAAKRLGIEFSKLRKAMSLQRSYDRETVNTIVRLAKMMMDNGRVDELGRGEVKKLIGLINGAAGKEDITTSAEKVVDMMIAHQLRECRKLLGNMLNVRGTKLSGSGVEIQGQLDIEGKRMLDAFKDAMKLSEESLNDRINDCTERMGSDDVVTSSNASVEYQGLMLAKQYLDDIKKSEEEETNLRGELKQEKESVNKENYGSYGSRKGFMQYVHDTEASIRENQTERIEKYFELMGKLGEGLASSVERAKAWREKEVQRVNEIRHNANSDLKGVPVQSQGKMPKGGLFALNSNNDIIRLLFQPFATFEKMLRFFGRKAQNGEGYLYNRFMRGWIDASDNEWRNKRAAHEVLDAKAHELFPDVKRWSEIFELERHMQTVPVEYWDNGERVSDEITQGEALYMYMVNKMQDGKMKLRKMGITEEDVDALKKYIDPRFIELGDWLQDTFLKEKRKDYNDVHERMFGASMAAIEDYFPLVVNKRNLAQETDITERDKGDTKPSTITGSVIKRKRNNKALSVHTDAFDVVLAHLDQMEHWAAFAEFNRDINTLLNYTAFKNKVLNMKSAEFGSGMELWKAFEDCCAIAADVYHPSTKRSSADNLAVNVAKGVTTAKIAFRIYTAAKQLLSMPAFWNGDASIKNLAKYTTIGSVSAWRWAMKNLPGFSKRWQSRQVGDVRLLNTDSDYSFWSNKWVRGINRAGMFANAAVDAITVAIGAKAVYETKKARYIKDGYSEAQAEKRALQDASIVYNSSQQSSENAFLSPLQLDRTWLSTMLTVFRSASMGYGRKLNTGLRNLKNRTKSGFKAESIEFMAKQMVRDGLSEAQAMNAAERIYNRGTWKSLGDVMMFGLVLPFFWNLGPYIIYLMSGGDDDKKKDMLDDAFMHTALGPIEGLSGGNVYSEMGNAIMKGDNLRYKNYGGMPLSSDFQSIINELGSDKAAAAQDIFNLLVQGSIGVNPETFTDMYAAIMDYCNGDMETAKEAAMLVMRMAQVPQSTIDELYIDELGMTGKEAKSLSAEELAKRYAEYKFTKNAPMTGWIYSDEEEEKAIKKYEKRFNDIMSKRIETMSDESLQGSFGSEDERLKKALGKEVAKRMDAKDTYGSPTTEYGKLYLRYRDYFDIAEDVLLQTAENEAKNAKNKKRQEDIKTWRDDITEIKQGLSGVVEDDKEIMEELRELRREAIKELGIK